MPDDGKWSLVYTLLGFRARHGEEDKIIPLKASTQDEAIVEAKAVWNKLFKRKERAWNKACTRYPFPNFGGEPKPRVRYECELPSQKQK